MMSPLFLTLLLSLFVSQIAGSCTAGQGVSVSGGCSCYSGYTASDCSASSYGTCNVTTSVDPLATEIVAEFQKSISQISQNYFTFTIVSNPRSQRYFNYIAANNATCAYPGTSFFTRSFNTTSCQDVFVGNISIPALVQTCTFTQTEQTNRTVISGTLMVSAIDSLGMFRDQNLVRTTNSILKISLNLPTYINVTSSPITVYSPISLLSAVTSQSYDSTTDKATILITTSLQWPYYLSGVNVTINPYAATSISVSVSITDNSLCNQTEISACAQVTTLVISNVAGSTLCVFNGLYSLTWSYNFRSGAAAALLPSNPTSVANVTLASDNVCSVIEIDAHLTGDIQSYSDATYTTTQLAYVAGNTLFFRSVVTADVNVQSVSVLNLYVLVSNTSVTVVSGGTPNAQFATANYNSSASAAPANEARFSFIATFGSASSNIFSTSNSDAVFSFQVQAELQITYITSFKKRDLESERLTVKKQVVLDTFHIRRVGQNAASFAAVAPPKMSLDTPNSAAGLSIGLAAPFVVGMAGAVLAN